MQIYWSTFHQRAYTIEKYYFFGKDRGYEKTNECKIIKKESSPTIIWETLNECNIMPLLRGTFPFHPYMAVQLNKNRTPKNYEVEIGAEF